MIKAILLDLDDTLIKTFETKKEAIKSLDKEYYQVNLTDTFIKSNWGRPIRDLLKSLFGDDIDVEVAFERWVKRRKNHPTATYEGTLSTLEKLTKKYLLGIITSKSKLYIDEDLDLSGISKDLFFVIQTEEDTNYHKPNPQVFDHILDQLKNKGIKATETLYVGDSILDYQAAEGAGIKFYGIPDRTTPKKTFESAGAKTIEKLADLLGILN